MSATILMAGLALTALAGGDGVSAEPRPAEVSPAPAAETGNDQAVSALAALAARQFDEGLFPAAEETLQRAIALSPRPRLFYNLAQAYRAEGKCAAARDAYRGFLAKASADDPTRARAERRLKDMQECADRAAASPALVAPPPEPPIAAKPPAPAPAPITPAVTESPATVVRDVERLGGAGAGTGRSRRVRLIGWGLIGAGVLAEVGALIFQLKASRIQADLDNRDPGVDPQAVPRLWAEGRHDARWALGSALAGAALGVAGGAALIINRDPGPKASYTAMLGWAAAF